MMGTSWVGATFQLGGGGLPSISLASKWLRRSPVALDITYLLDAFAPLTGQRFTECLLRAGAGVGVGSVEGGNAQIQGLPDAGRRRVLVDLLTVSEASSLMYMPEEPILRYSMLVVSPHIWLLRSYWGLRWHHLWRAGPMPRA